MKIALAVQLADQDRACATIAFATTNFCSGKMLMITDKIEQGSAWGAISTQRCIIENKTDQNNGCWLLIKLGVLRQRIREGEIRRALFEY